MKRIEIAALCGILLSIALSSLSVFADDCEALHGEVLRLHIIANSDSPEDQALKLKVRDRILAETGDLFSAEKNLDAAKRDAAASLDRLCRLAEDELSENGCDDPVFAEVCRMWFDTRFYGDYTLPAGTYDAVRLTIGKAEGKNWWCVLFPPLCLLDEGTAPLSGDDADSDSAKSAAYGSGSSEVAGISGDSGAAGTSAQTDSLTKEQRLKLRWKTLELLEGK